MNPRTYCNSGPKAPKADVSPEELAARRAAHMALPKRTRKKPLSEKWPRDIYRCKQNERKLPPKKTQAQLIDEAIARAKSIRCELVKIEKMAKKAFGAIAELGTSDALTSEKDDSK